MALIQIGPGNNPANLVTRRQYRLDTRDAWTDEWKEAPYLELLTLTLSAAPTMPRASFRWRSGKIKREDQFAVTNAKPYRDLTGTFVKVTLLGDQVVSTGLKDFRLWTGIFVNQDSDVGGTAEGAVAGEVGSWSDQAQVAFGLEYLLDLSPITTAWATNDGTTAIEVEAPVPFNEKFVRGVSDTGNRSQGTISFDMVSGDTGEAYVFADAPAAYNGGGALPDATLSQWTVRNILEYLLAYYGPADFDVALSGQFSALDQIVYPHVEVKNKTVYKMLNELLDRRRGYGWNLEVSDDPNGGDDRVSLLISPVLDQDVSVGSATIPGNRNVVSIPLDNNPVIERASLEIDGRANYGKIQVLGKHILSCFTVSFADGNLETAWRAVHDVEDPYVSPLGATADLADAARTALVFQDIFRSFRIPSTFDWTAGNGQRGAKTNVNPGVNDSGTLDTTATPPIRNWGREFERTLPIKEEISKPNGQPEFKRPFAMLYDETLKQLVLVHKTGDGGHVSPIDGNLAFRIECNPNHTLALNHWPTSPAPLTNKQPKYDYAKIVATVAVRTDKRLQVTTDIPGGDPQHVLSIEVPDAELWYIAPNTIVDIQNGQPKSWAGSSIVRDDSARLRYIAALARAWYGPTRSPCHIRFANLVVDYRLGMYLRTVSTVVSELAVNAPVTSIRYDFGDNPSTEIETSFSELDITGFAAR